MIGLLPIIALGILILILGFRLFLQSRSSAQSPAVTMQEFVNAREALDAVFVEAAAIERIFSTDDMDFVAHASSRKAKRLFLNERKALAIQWLRKTQKQVAQLRDIHLRLASYTDQPSPGTELKLAAKYLDFFLVSHLLLLLLWLRGPFKARWIVSYTSRVAGYFCTIFSLRLANVNALRLHSDDAHPGI